jgi:hypothetical protein
MVDECWAVEPTVVDEGLEPSILERLSPQLLMASTAHRRATSLMRRRLETALVGLEEGDEDTLVMLWGADKDDDMHDPDVWRAASPHWTEHRRKLIAGKLDRALRGEADPDADDIDPVAGFQAQYLNVWPEATAPRGVAGTLVVSQERWDALNGYAPQTPIVAAVESWYSEGASVALAAVLSDRTVGVSVRTFDSVPEAGDYALGSGAQVVMAGKSIASDVSLSGAKPVGGTTHQAVADLRRYIDDKSFCHDGGLDLAHQVLELRTVPSADGMRLSSRSRADAVKAVSWAIEEARRWSESPRVY